MSPHDYFLLTVATLLGQNDRAGSVSSPNEVAATMSAAWAVNPDALAGHDPAECGLSFVRFHMVSGAKAPTWLSDFEEARRHRVRISLNRDAEALQWWMQAEALSEGIPASCLPIVCDRVESITVSPQDAEHFASWGESIPGWHEKPFIFDALVTD
jgi:hypothetical protein